MKFDLLKNLKLLTIANLFLAKHSSKLSIKISLPMNMKMPAVISRENFILSWVEQEKSLIILGLDQLAKPHS